jgi:hypothetical protein
MLTLTPKHASGSLRSWAARGEVGTGSPQKMRPLKDNQSECRSIGTECALEDSRCQYARPVHFLLRLLSRLALADRFIRLIGFPPMHYLESWKRSAD